MQISYKWLKEYVDFNYTPDELTEKLTMAGLEVEGMEYLGEGLEDIIIGKIEKIEEHPNADKLVICRVMLNKQGKVMTVVTGAPNVEEGKMVPVAEAGTVLPNGMRIEKSDLRGVISEGMICSIDELGLAEERADGIMILSDNAPLGGSIIDHLKLDDYILKLDLTPNYARCLGMIGIAREIKSLFTGGELNLPEIKFTESKEEKNINQQAEIIIEDPDLCPRYTGRLVKDVKIKASPLWMKRKLKAAGIRSINNVVDITNYVLMEYNQPLHAFDFDKIKNSKIIVRRAESEEEILTLDEKTRVLDDEMLVITDEDGPLAVAGVMGGYESEVTEKTNNVLIESAYFNPISIRKTAKKLGLHSESSHRFERGVDIEKAVEANNRACQLLEKYADGTIVPGVIDQYPLKYESAELELETKRVNQLLGLELETAKIAGMLEKLDFPVKVKEGIINVKVPSFRTDVSQPADLVEEIARVYGYNNIPSTTPISKQLGRRTVKQKFKKRVERILKAGGLDEIITYSLQDKKNYSDLKLNSDSQFGKFVSIKNPLSEAFAIMRTTILVGIINTLAANARRQTSQMGVFEIGTAFYYNGNSSRPKEKQLLGGGIFGIEENIWQENAPEFYHLKGILEILFDKIQLKNYRFVSDDSREYLHPGRTAEIYSGRELLGFIGEIHPEIAEKSDLPAGTTVFEIDFDSLYKATPKVNYHYKKLPKYPSVFRDLAVVVKDDIEVAEILNAIKEKGGEILKDLDIFDLYHGNQIKEGHKSIAFKLKFQSEEKTLRDDEVNKQFKKIINYISDKFSAEIRGN
ncbi:MULTISPECIES: phenylalanine--tRNA ligase subunit beta [unclassified Halanaerobium]|uniref:phenylalanine--tRNA ligase subunit beta n=1 Tax=unclassified Halanaerobium TaxID=2641197 RepID=UPI000DF43696|nr:MULTISPECIES: phenylalanine--tRNA ligase subunit beta [unclassified Halanaerobium]RCW50488.1 phenylalanyl-tRNA synthetase beta subunit [Halanaerobium sp. MA284_MarDTE_T2]RCW85975.1 phenylalanyl-tRNA synthetase beta subunit [Halanaerobium sp. DL-01]